MKAKLYKIAMITYTLLKAVFFIRMLIEACNAVPYLYRLYQEFLETDLGRSLCELPWSTPPYSVVATAYERYLQFSGMPTLILLLSFYALTRFPYDKVKQVRGAIKATKAARHYVEHNCFSLSIISDDYEDVIKIPPHSEVKYGPMTIVRTGDDIHVCEDDRATRYLLERAVPLKLGAYTVTCVNYRF